MDVALVNIFLLLVLLPAWLVAGLMDWWCHRRAHVETTVGPKESLLHLVLSAQAAMAITPALLLEINAAIIALLIVMFVAHEVSTNLDVRMALPVRAFTPMEVRAHNFLTGIPLAGLLLVMATHADQSAALFGVGAAPADFSLRWKDPQLPRWYLASWFVAALVMNVLPFTEELWRGMRAQRRRRPHCSPG